MSLTVPGWLLAGLLLSAAVTWALRRWRQAAAASGVVLAGLLWLWLRSVTLDDQTSLFLVYGRTLMMTEGIRLLFLWLVAAAGMLFVLSLLWPQGRHFVPVTLAVLALLAVMLMIRPFIFGVLAWLAAAALLAILIEQNGQIRAALRYLVMAVIAGLLLLTVDWMLAADQAALQETTVRLVALAFIILMAGLPFHIWVSSLVMEASPLVIAFLLGLVQLALIFFVYALLAAFPWLQEMAAFGSLVRWSSGLMAVTAGLLALTAADYDRLIGSLLLLDMSVSLALLLTPVEMGWETAVLVPIVRFVSLLLAALGSGGLQAYLPAGGFVAWRGWGRRFPLETAVFAFGILSLLGLPLTVGFSGRWAALILIAQQPMVGLNLPIVLLLAMGGGIYGVWRGLSPLLAKGEVDFGDGVVINTTRMRLAALILGLTGGLWLAAWPQAALTYAHRLANVWLLAD